MTKIYDFNVTKIDGAQTNLADYKGKVMLVVNVASKCGLTPQYEGLEKIYKNYKDKGFEILGFPANEFLAQEPGSNDEIQQFCTMNYGVDFPMFSKIVVKGEGQAPWTCFVEFYLRLHIPNSTGSFKLYKRETGTTEVCVSSLGIAGLNLFWGNASPTVLRSSS